MLQNKVIREIVHILTINTDNIAARKHLGDGSFCFFLLSLIVMIFITFRFCRNGCKVPTNLLKDIPYFLD